MHGKRSRRKVCTSDNFSVAPLFFSVRQGNRLLCIRSDKIYLIDMKTRITYREQRMADLEHWITNGHQLSAANNELVLEFRNKTKWRLQLNNTADLRAITVYLWKIVNIEGCALFDKHIPLNPSMHRHSQSNAVGRRMTILPTSSNASNSHRNPYQTITDLYNRSTHSPLKDPLTHADHTPNLTRLIRSSRSGTLPGLNINPSDHTQPICFSSDLEELKYLFDFPEEVAIRLTEVEHEIFLSVPPLQYLRHLTLDMSSSATGDASRQAISVRILIQRFQAVDFLRDGIRCLTSRHRFRLARSSSN
jgi:hypothetical protein